MKKFFAIVSVIIIVGWACKKEEPIPECEINNTGQVQVLNQRNSVYQLYIDTTYFVDIKPNETHLLTYPVGRCTVKFYTDDGYYYKVVTIKQCDIEKVTFTY